jgi:hypothetical protein
MALPTSRTVKRLYKQLLFLGRDYPTGYEKFREGCKRAFMKNKDETRPEVIQQHIEKAEYVVKELEALYMLKKYRTLKRRYYDES